MGKRMHVGNPRSKLPWVTVVGVVTDTKGGARDLPAGDQFYMPERQPASFFGSDYHEKLAFHDSGYIVVRSVFPPEQVARVLRSTVAEVDPHLALEGVQTMDAMMAGVEAPRRFNTGLIGAFASGALLLAVTGIYAVVAFSVSARTQEIAIRLALGAQRGNVARLVLMSGARLGLAGCVLGVVGSLATTRAVKGLLFATSATDPFILAAGVGIILLFVLLASALPAARAAQADPIKALHTS